MRYRLMASYLGASYQAAVGPTDRDVTLFAAPPPPEEHGFSPAPGGIWRKQVRLDDLGGLWESRPIGSYHGEPCLVLDDLGDRLHIVYLGMDERRAAQLGYWEVDRGVFEVVVPRHDITDLAEERHEFPITLLLSALPSALGAADPGPANPGPPSLPGYPGLRDGVVNGGWNSQPGSVTPGQPGLGPGGTPRPGTPLGAPQPMRGQLPAAGPAQLPAAALPQPPRGPAQPQAGGYQPTPGGGFRAGSGLAAQAPATPPQPGGYPPPGLPQPTGATQGPGVPPSPGTPPSGMSGFQSSALPVPGTQPVPGAPGTPAAGAPLPGTGQPYGSTPPRPAAGAVGSPPPGGLLAAGQQQSAPPTVIQPAVPPAGPAQPNGTAQAGAAPPVTGGPQAVGGLPPGTGAPVSPLTQSQQTQSQQTQSQPAQGQPPSGPPAPTAMAAWHGSPVADGTWYYQPGYEAQPGGPPAGFADGRAAPGGYAQSAPYAQPEGYGQPAAGLGYQSAPVGLNPQQPQGTQPAPPLAQSAPQPVLPPMAQAAQMSQTPLAAPGPAAADPATGGPALASPAPASPALAGPVTAPHQAAPTQVPGPTAPAEPQASSPQASWAPQASRAQPAQPQPQMTTGPQAAALNPPAPAGPAGEVAPSGPPTARPTDSGPAQPAHSGVTANALSKLTGAVRGRRAARKPRLAMSAIFADLVDMADIPRSAYAVDEEVTGAMCLFKTEGGYEVFSCAEDARHEVRFFEDEEAAYFYLFGVLVAEALRSGRLGPQQHA